MALAAFGVVLLCASCTRVAARGPTAASPPSAGSTRSAQATTSPAPRLIVPTITLFFTRSHQLCAVSRETKGTQTAEDLLLDLIAGPEDRETKGGIATSIPSETGIRKVSVQDGLAEVDVSRAFESSSLGPLSIKIRLAQVIYTLTRLDSVRQVTLKVEGRLLDGKSAGLPHDAPFSREDFEDVVPDVLIESPGWGEKICSPLVVQGSARAEKGTFQLSLFDQRGNGLASDSVSTEPGKRTFFEFCAEFTPIEAGRCELEASMTSMRDGRQFTAGSVVLEIEG